MAYSPCSTVQRSYKFMIILKHLLNMQNIENDIAFILVMLKFNIW